MGWPAMRSARPLASAVLLALAVTLAAAGAGLAAGPFDALLGSWSGAGQIRYTDGKAEGVRCNAYYSGGGPRLRLAIRCRSASNEIEIRGQLVQQGDKVTGTWEERTFNASGEASGRASGGRITLAVTGGGFSGTMSVTQSGRGQVVVISTQGIAMKSVSVTLARS